MNKSGHLALGVASAAVGLLQIPKSLSATETIVFMAAAAVASLLPDLDHKTSTMSNLVQLKAKYRSLSKVVGGILLAVGILSWVMGWGMAALLIGGGSAALGLSRLRNIALLLAGITLLYIHFQLGSHWIVAVMGGALCIMPAVKHRGFIHSPEFAVLLSIGLYTFQQEQTSIVQAAAIGLIIGWWAHLLGDIFGREGITFLVLPKIKLALRWFDNGGIVEKVIARSLWLISVPLVVYYLLQSSGSREILTILQ
ncbi:hypothetical protein D3P09_02715 [Paenibacillus pinisoli]|uniref:Metal-dependent hydrolase n=1 Tax=Paenibacillus pinisoli TaxID=1276110 RepID=A0A3A6PNI7_9BACL|nr:metal-dependent hydrolase [Paenibacillus pinisoli]RJX40948.1 hypothetical protein D3P09_02715 [Paenibacillus pinisoli]